MAYLEEHKNLEKIAEHLDKIQVPYGFKEIGNNENDSFPAIICTYRYKNLDFDVVVYNIEEWIHVKALVMNAANFSSKALLTIYELCLELNYDLPEVTFSASEKNIYIEVDCLVNVDFDDFKAEFLSIGNGIEIFNKTIKPNDGFSIKSTKGTGHLNIKK